jgi:cytochrome d ubiquinol oxidase subunit I
MFLLGWVDEATQTTTGFNIPCLLSFLAYQDIHATVAGIDSFAPDPTPPINLLFQVYHLMINAAPLLAGIAGLAGLWYVWDRRLLRSRFVLWLLVLSVFIGEIAITAGWWTAEVGRQPWIVYDVLLTSDGVSPTLSAFDVGLSLGMFLFMYALLLALFLFLANRKIQAGPDPLDEVETVAVHSLPDTFREVFRKRPFESGPAPVGDAATVPAATADGGEPAGGAA